MKKIKILLLSLTFLVTFNVLAADLDVKFTNMKISGSNLVFDIEIQTDAANTYLASFEAYIDYNTAAFGSSIAAGVTVAPIGFLTSPNYSISKNNSGARLYINAYNYIPNVLPAVNVPTTYGKILRVTIPIVNASQPAGIAFACSLMGNGQIYYTAPTGGGMTLYAPINCANDLLALPLNPNVSLLLSELGAPTDVTNDFVEIYNAGATTVNFDGFYEWYLNINGVGTKLTGSIASGAAMVVNITAAGNSLFVLSTYGDAVNGTIVDVYNGGASGFNFTDKHAVRHFSVNAPNSSFSASEWVLSWADDIDMTRGSHKQTLTWNGATNVWRLPSNWSGNLIPDAAHNVIIPNTGITPVTSYGEYAFAHNLTIGSIGLVIESALTGDGSIITYGTVTGNATVKRYLDADRYWYISRPVTSANAGVFLHTWLFTYDETAGNWGAFIVPEATPLNVMQGYAVWTSSINSWNPNLPAIGDTTVAYTGVLNTGNISRPLTYTVSGGPFGNGWNFVGNPYPSEVDWDATGWTRTNLVTNSYSVWTGTTYAAYTVGGGGVGTNGATNFIPAAQGFFVQSSAAGTLGVTNAVRAHSDNVFMKNETITPNKLSLTITNGTVSDETVIYFDEEATTEVDYSFDAKKMMAQAAPQAPASAFNNMTQTTSVKMGINAPETGSYTLTASNIESFDATTPLYLEDLATGQIVNLREVNSYTFAADEGTAERFLVHFTAVQGIGDGPASEVTSVYALDQKVFVQFNGIDGEISIYNILGQEVSRTAASEGLNILTVPQGNAVYVVKVISGTQSVTKKVFVN